jgi:hypothetical protein
MASAVASLGRIEIAATAADHQATINASAEQLNVDANAVVGLARPWPTTLQVRADDSALEKLPLEVGTRYEGRLRATVNATGDLAQPAAGQATASIEALSGSWNGQPFSVTSLRALRYENQLLTIDGLELTARDSSLILTGDVPLTATAGAGELAIEAHYSR